MTFVSDSSSLFFMVTTSPPAHLPVKCGRCPGVSGNHDLACPVEVTEGGHVLYSVFRLPGQPPATHDVGCGRCGYRLSYASWMLGVAPQGGVTRCPGWWPPVMTPTTAPAPTPPLPSSYYGPHTSSAPFDLSDDWNPSPRPSPPVNQKPSCVACGLELCAYLDTYWGKDDRGSQNCEPCRKRLEIK